VWKVVEGREEGGGRGGGRKEKEGGWEGGGRTREERWAAEEGGGREGGMRRERRKEDGGGRDEGGMRGEGGWRREERGGKREEGRGSRQEGGGRSDYSTLRMSPKHTRRRTRKGGREGHIVFSMRRDHPQGRHPIQKHPERSPLFHLQSFFAVSVLIRRVCCFEMLTVPRCELIMNVAQIEGHEMNLTVC
jgi:hypothetical protein